MVLAVALGGFVYFYEVKHGKPRDEAAETGKPAFSFKREDVAAITLTRAGQKVVIENHEGKWVIDRPVRTSADQAAVDSLISDLAGARVERNINASVDEIKAYGLAAPTVVVEVKLKSGEQHSIRLGAKDFSGLNVYGQIDAARDVALLGSSVLTSADKPLDDLRDRAVLGISQYEVSGLTLDNENGRITLAKNGVDWQITQPVEAPAEESEVSSLLGEITSAKAVEIASETTEDLGKYGLDKPKLTLIARLQGGEERVLTLGSKSEERYFAKNSAQPQIFKVESSLFDKLNTKPFNLRDKHVVKLNKDELTSIRIKNPNLTMVAEKNKEGKWIVKEPADKKDKEAQSWRIFDPLENNQATEILDKPPAAIVAKLRKPAVEIKLTGKDGKTTSLLVSAADGDSAYVRVEGRPEIFKVGKQMAEGLNFKMADVVL